MRFRGSKAYLPPIWLNWIMKVLLSLHDMRRELTDFRAAIREASTEEFQAMLEGQVCTSVGCIGFDVKQVLFTVRRSRWKARRQRRSSG